MTPAQQTIFEIIRADVCGQCIKSASWTVETCRCHERRCHAGYKRQSEAIYEAVVKPLEGE